ncbi:MAG: (Na+)-NQR maturation NqrM [Pseudomonadota bacterium]
MATFAFTFAFLLLVVLGMSLGVLLMGKTIKGSCGGLNAISGADKCVVCKKDVDPNSPLRDKLQCKRARKMVERMEAEAAEKARA